MLIIGCDYHPGFQQIAFVDTDTGEFQERRLEHPRKRRSFIVSSRSRPRRCGWGWKPAGRALVRATAGRIEVRVMDWGRQRDRRKRERKQKTDRQDAQHI